MDKPEPPSLLPDEMTADVRALKGYPVAVPLTGALVALVLAFTPGWQWLALPVVLIVLIHAVWTGQKLVERLREPDPTVRATQGQVQPEGPSFQEVLRVLPDPVMVVSGREADDMASRRIVFANTAAITQFRMPAGGGHLVSALRNPEVLEAVDEALFGGINASTRFDSNGSQVKHWHALTSPLPVANDEVRLALLVLRDETEARRAERMRADFLANASHELRSPLTSLTGFIETLRGPARDDKAARERFLNIMTAQADRMGRLINDLLSLSRIEMNEHVPPSGEVDIVMTAHDVVDGLSLLASEKGVKLSLKGPKSGRVKVTGDRDQLLQVMQNLIDNALKYAPRDSEVCIVVTPDLPLDQALTAKEGAAKLVLLRPDRSPEARYCRIDVRDGGPGIRREFLPRLAERFYRVEGQKSGDRLGTGLGLAIVKHIVNRHRGGLMVESRSHVKPGDDVIIAEAPGDKNLPSFTTFSASFPQVETGSGVGSALSRD